MTEKYELRLCSNGVYYLYEDCLVNSDISFDKFNRESAKELVSILNKQNKEIEDLLNEKEEKIKQFNQLKEDNSLRFAKFRQKMCDLLWENNCDHIGLSDEKNAELIFNIAHNICNELLKEYDISDKEK